MYVRARSRSLAHVCLEIVEGQSYKHSHLVCRDPEMSECDETSRGPLSIITTTSISPSRALRSLSSVVTRARLCQRERRRVRGFLGREVLERREVVVAQTGEQTSLFGANGLLMKLLSPNIFFCSARGSAIKGILSSRLMVGEKDSGECR